MYVADIQGNYTEKCVQGTRYTKKATRILLQCQDIGAGRGATSFRTTMSTSFATPDSSHSDPRTPSRGQPPSGKVAKSSSVGKVSKYILPGNREQYQKFGYDRAFKLEPFKDKTELRQFLKVKHPQSVPDVQRRGQKSFLALANEVAKFIQSEHYLFLYLAFLPT